MNREVSSWRLWLAIFIPIYFTIKRHNGKHERQFIVRKRVLHKGFQLLEEYEFLNKTDMVYEKGYDLVKSFDNWEDTSKAIQKVKEFLNTSKSNQKLDDLREVI